MKWPDLFDNDFYKYYMPTESDLNLTTIVLIDNLDVVKLQTYS